MAHLLNTPSPPPRAGTPNLQQTETGGSSSSTAAVPPTGGTLRAIAPAPPGYQRPALGSVAKGKQPAIKQPKPVYKPLRERLPPPVKGERVWLCCKCLCKRREEPTPQYNRFGWEPKLGDLCWLVLKKLKTSVRPETYVEADKDICGHEKCESCIEEYYEPDDSKRDTFNFVNEYGTKLNWEHAPWFHGPWKNKHGLPYAIQQFRDYRKSDYPPGKARFMPWWCCQCKDLDLLTWNAIVDGHQCNKEYKGKKCRHYPCVNCSTEPWPPRPLTEAQLRLQEYQQQYGQGQE